MEVQPPRHQREGSVLDNNSVSPRLEAPGSLNTIVETHPSKLGIGDDMTAWLTRRIGSFPGNCG